MALDPRFAAQSVVVPAPHVGAWVLLIAVIVTGLGLAARFGPQVLPYLTTAVAR